MTIRHKAVNIIPQPLGINQIVHWEGDEVGALSGSYVMCRVARIQPQKLTTIQRSSTGVVETAIVLKL